MILEIILLVIWCFDAIICVAWLIAEHRRKHPKPQVPCDSCQHLVRKQAYPWRYRCAKHSSFDDPPLFCDDWEKRTKDYNYTDDGGNNNAAD